MSMRALAAFAAVVPFSIRDRAPWERSLAFHPEPAPGDPPPTPPVDAPKFTQAELDKYATDRAKKATAEATEAKAKLEELTKAQVELQAKADELELKGKSAEEKARIAAEKAAKQIEAEKAAALKDSADSKAIAAAAIAALRGHVVGGQISQALIAAKALPDGLKHAVPAFMAEVVIVTDDDHKITSITFDGVLQKDLATAATAWLAKNPLFAPAIGGGGTRGGAGGLGGKPLHEMTVDELLVAAKR